MEHGGSSTLYSSDIAESHEAQQCQDGNSMDDVQTRATHSLEQQQECCLGTVPTLHPHHWV